MKRLQRWGWPAGLAGVMVVAAAFGESARAALRWQRDLLLAEPWRVLTGHLVHLDTGHLLLNLAALTILWALVGDQLRVRDWSLVALACALAIGLGLLASEVYWYVGLSGVLYGMLAAGALALWRAWRTGAVFLFVFLALRTGLEVFGVTPGGDDVVVEAHWLGTGAGLAAGILCVLLRRRQAV